MYEVNLARKVIDEYYLIERNSNRYIEFKGMFNTYQSAYVLHEMYVLYNKYLTFYKDNNM
jgi:hypothetical protein